MVFNNVNSGIILEDDIIVDLDFFNFCFSMLKNMKHLKQFIVFAATIQLVLIFIMVLIFSKYFFSWGCFMEKQVG